MRKNYKTRIGIHCTGVLIGRELMEDVYSKFSRSPAIIDYDKNGKIITTYFPRDFYLTTSTKEFTYEEIELALHETFQHCDIIIDFSRPELTMKLIECAVSLNKAMVIATTGLNIEQMNRLKEASTKIPIFYSCNFSVGANLLFKLTDYITSVLHGDYDIGILEAHHKFKKDAPSGSALKLKEFALNGMKRCGKEMEENKIGIQSIRGGDIVGEHTVLFLIKGERIEITHKVTNRDVFTKGACDAAIWLQDKPPGLYDMTDIFNLTFNEINNETN